ncbi:MAG: outer membrane protein [Oleispira sp.]|jgi:outer membrane protein
MKKKFVTHILRFFIGLGFSSLCSTSSADAILHELYMRGLQYDDSYNQVISQLKIDGLDFSSINAKFYPNITSSIYQIETESSSKGPTQSVTSDGRYSSTGYEIRFNQVIYDQELLNQADSYNLKKNALKYKLLVAQQELIIQVADAYWSVLEALHILSEEKSRLDLYQILYEQAKKRKAQGIASTNEFNQIEAEALEQEYQTDLALSSYEFVANELYQKTFFEYQKGDVNNIELVQCPILEFPKQYNDDYLDIALAHNQELNLYREELRAFQQERNAKKAAYLPKLNLSLDYSNSDQVGGSFDGSETNRTQAKLSLDWPIYLGGQRSVDVKRSVAQLGAQQRKVELYIPKLQRKLGLILKQIVTRKKSLDAIEFAEKQISKKYRRMMDEVIIGSITKTDAMQVSIDVKRLLSKKVTACKSLVLNQLELMKILGVLDAQQLMK